MEITMNELLEGKSTIIKNKQFLSTKAYIEPFVDRMSAFTNDFKIQAEEIFKELKKAYEENNIKRVKEILENLEKEKLFVNKSESITEKSKLKIEILNLKNKLDKIISEIESVKSSEPYITIIKIDDWDNYFKIKKSILKEELNYLQNSE